jgi:hypothetical protein
MIERRWFGRGAAALLLLAAGTAAGQGAPRPAAKATIADVAWIAGDWQGEAGPGALSQEVWAAPAGDCMMGMWRLVIDGRVKLFESLSIVAGDGGPVLRLRHFGRDGVGWEEKDKPLTLPLVETGEGLAAFSGAGRSGPLRIVYRRTGDDAMTVAVEKDEGREVFEFRRAGAWRGEPRPPAAALAPAQRP